MTASALPEWAEAIVRDLGAIGLNAVGVADGRPFEAVLTGCRSVIVLGSGGRALWEALVADLAAHPEHLTRELHPQDAFVHRALLRADPSPPPSRRWIRCAADEPEFVDFRPLAAAAGLGWESRIGLAISPEFGLWLGLRAACFTTEALEPTGPLAGSSPCEPCPAPCIGACPAAAVTRARWSVERCSRHHEEATHCLGVCHSRNVCPAAPEHAHSRLEHHYHADRRTGRALLARALGIEADEERGEGPYWDDWKKQ